MIKEKRVENLSVQILYVYMNECRCEDDCWNDDKKTKQVRICETMTGII